RMADLPVGDTTLGVSANFLYGEGTFVDGQLVDSAFKGADLARLGRQGPLLQSPHEQPAWRGEDGRGRWVRSSGRRTHEPAVDVQLQPFSYLLTHHMVPESRDEAAPREDIHAAGQTGRPAVQEANRTRLEQRSLTPRGQLQEGDVMLVSTRFPIDQG